jgi:alpha-galactosidase
VREAPTIVLIGAGSTSFGLSTLHDLYADAVFQRATVWLVDLDRSALERTRNVANALEAFTRREIDIRVTDDRRVALPGADAVVVSVEVDRDRRWQIDFDIPRRHGVRHVLGENAGPGGLAHALRTIPLVVQIAHDISELAPNALFLNFTNPEGRICTAFRRHLDQPVIGLCHEVELARRRFSSLLGRELECRAAGLNHLTALVAARDSTTGEDVTHEMNAAIASLADEDGDTFAFVRHLYERDGVVVATSDSHAGEYYREAIEYAPPKDFLGRQVAMRAFVDDVARAIVQGTMDFDAFIQWEASEPLRPILRAAISGTPERIASAILPNAGLIPALRTDCAVEVSAVASADWVAGDTSTDLPAAFVTTLQREVEIQQLVGDAALLGSRDAALEALRIDPLVDSTEIASAILDDFERAHRDLWPALVRASVVTRRVHTRRPRTQ